MAADLVEALRLATSPGQVVHDDLHRALYGRDASILTGRAGVVCFPRSAQEVAGCVRVAAEHGRAVVPRGAGTGLAGGAVPAPGTEPVVVATSRMNRVLEVDAVERFAWVEPGVLNLDLSRAVEHLGLHFAPDPSSQQSCTIGGNVANNSGGPHCLAYGVTSAHVLAVEVVLGDGQIALLGGLDPEPVGYDLRGAFVGSEGTMGIATRIAVRLTPRPPAVRTILAAFATVGDAARTVSDVIAGGVVPAALEMMDRAMTNAVEDYANAGLPREAAAILLIEVDGLDAGVEAEAGYAEGIARENGAISVRVAADDAERALLWKARKSAFGAIARVAPDYYLHDAVVPRSQLEPVLDEVYAIGVRHGLLMMNVFHAGDGNLHPLIVFDAREAGVLDRVHQAGVQIVEACVRAGGMLSGEHGIGLEKRDFMPLVFSEVDLAAQAAVRAAFDPGEVCNPAKVIPLGAGCGELVRRPAPAGAWV